MASYLPKGLAGTVDQRLGIIFAQPDPAKGFDAAKRLASELRGEHPDAAASLLEGLDEMFTVRQLGISSTLAKIGISSTLAKTLTNTNCIESMISIARKPMAWVKKWTDGSMKKRWVAAGMLEAERAFRRVRGYKNMDELVIALRRHVGATTTPTDNDQAAA